MIKDIGRSSTGKYQYRDQVIRAANREVSLSNAKKEFQVKESDLSRLEHRRELSRSVTIHLRYEGARA